MPLSPAGGPGGGGGIPQGGPLTEELDCGSFNLYDISQVNAQNVFATDSIECVGAIASLQTTGAGGAGTHGNFVAISRDSSVTVAGVQAATGQQARLIVTDPDGNDLHVLATNGAGFFGATPVAQPTGVAVTAAAIHAALVTLGLITA